MPPPSLSPAREPGESTNEYLLSPSETGAGIPTPLPAGQDPLPCAQPRAPFHESEIPSTNESHSARPSFRPSTFVGRHQCPDFAVKCLASNMFSRPIPRGARPAGRPLFAWAIRAAWCPSVSATECPASTPATVTIPGDGSANRPYHQAALPFRVTPAELTQVRGRWPFGHVDPRFGDRSPPRIYPNLINSSTPCRAYVPFPAWKRTRTGDPAVLDPLSDESARSAGTSPTFPLGPPFVAPRER